MKKIIALLTLSCMINESYSQSWLLIGNSNSTLPTSPFIGTTENVDVVFKRNDIESGRLGSAATAFGRATDHVLRAHGRWCGIPRDSLVYFQLYGSLAVASAHLFIAGAAVSAGRKRRSPSDLTNHGIYACR